MKSKITIALVAMTFATVSASAQWVPEPEVVPDYTRLTKTYTQPGGNTSLTLTVDFPDAGAPYAGQVNSWLTRLADNAFIPNDNYGGQPWDHQALGQFVARKFFRFAKKEISHDSVTPNPYAYSYSMLANTVTEEFATYQISSQLSIGNKQTMTGKQYVTYLYNTGDATNDVLFAHNKFKAVKEALLNVAFGDAGFMQSRLVKGQGVQKASQLRPLFSPGGDDGWDGMVLPPAALTPQGVVFSFAPAVAGPSAKNWWHFTVPYSALRKCFSKEAEAAITAAYPLALQKN